MSSNRMKETELGLIPINWTIKSVRELIEEEILDKPLDGNHGAIHPTQKDFVPVGIPFIMASDINNGEIEYSNCKYITLETSKNLKKGFAKEGDVLLTHKATIGRVALVKNINTPYIVLTPQVTYYRVLDYTKLNNVFLKYYFLWSEFNKLFNSWAQGGSTRAYLGITAQQKLPIILPTIEEQKVIANILSTIDEKIKINNAIKNNLQSISQLLFKHWFIDFEFPNEEGLPYKSSSGEMVDSELGMIPKGWEVRQLKEVKEMGTLIMGQSPSGSSYNQDKIGVPLINGAADIKDGNLVPNKYTTEPKKTTKVNDLIFCIRATIGLLTVADGEYCLGRGVAVITDIEEDYYEYIYQVIDNSFEKFKKTASGSVYINLSKDDFNNMKLIVPNNEILKKYHSVCAAILKLIIFNKKQIKGLANLRDTLLPKLMNGEINLENIEI